jgi:hypothetical protein
MSTAPQKPGRTPAPPKPLIFCYDGSRGAEDAIRRAGELLAARPALVLTVWEPAPALGPG